MVYNKKLFTLLLYVVAIFSVAASIFALVDITITNMTLVFYSLSVPCIWKICSMLSWRQGYLAKMEIDKRKKYALGIIFTASVYISVSILSLYSCVMLFPHPFIHKFLIGFIYAVGSMNALFLCYTAYCVRHGKIPRMFATRFKMQQILDRITKVRKDYCATQNFSDEMFRKQQQKPLTEYNAKKYFFKRVLSTCGYVAIFMWIFVVIPWMSLSEIYFFYKIIFAIVITISSINIFKSIRKSYKQCFVYAHGIEIHGLGYRQCIFWEQIHYIVMQDVEMEIYCFDKQTIIVPFQNVKKDQSFLESLFKPGDLLFSKKIPKDSSFNDPNIVRKLFKQENRKISSEAKMVEISSSKLYVVDKNQLFYLKKTACDVKVFSGKMPFEIFFVHEVIWKQMERLKELRFIKNFMEQYRDRVRVSDEIANET